jgi:hypothetical protein
LTTFAHSSAARLVAAVVIVCVSAVNIPVAVVAGADPAGEDLREIQYKYYFRGKYGEAIGALTTFLARTDVKGEVAVSAREFLAASLVLSGNRSGGRDQFLRLLNENENYPGPDPAVFKTEVVDAFADTRDTWIALKLRTAPDTTGDDREPAAVTTVTPRPIYKKWWFYAGLAAAAAVAVVALAPGEEDPPAPAAPTGTVSVGVRIQ